MKTPLAVVRTNTSEQALQATKAVITGGIQAIEITFSVPQAEQVIATLKADCQDDPRVIIGAGTILDPQMASTAIAAGAEFIVSPCFDQGTADLCHLYQVPYLPGCMTINEIKQAMQAGSEVVKLFPANHFHSNFIKTVQAPLPQVAIMPTGGINLANLLEWKQAGALMVGIGGNLFQGVSEGNYELVSKTAQEYSKIWHQTL
ncbi:bifunctional 2-keto-4-hydroxyglutarate aldolase/2-keto-3-deoxy-6-phosphogluconate aldolase [Vagococcus intermedius]|uniref:Bifunctional 2-keto-4-hydroxyglutarate aldolase/2-keto-3-deoxy-6-phosphogluconate aldolase n=1 Tax=Vagococcus intermedius TaxID=2991418 RepID=A0AAF0CWL6_9ENTE|nr:bifunctional 2-keto-4-hydroxyglutarate aldolase/2-keto-3-deoxy-6-phosphogluconate aldolase [Vagococcus intermedius]WEG74345.1 bifunctional 2-keto-4-hydroxyglutarate aldolase/2-keto-3-deoxy-6-phosphogluconate aldolase [Vagococcus intermedius]WEG76429.1 bifunctional 2-keto-4-hydroxyglutarate aldolase/2-keto-3-deoxy-6-phosphogluconate aldolase [Vagococcus intermedius]